MNQLSKFREEAMMTVRELSERSGVSEDTITKIENGHREGRPVTLRKLAHALGVDAPDLKEQARDDLQRPYDLTSEKKVDKYGYEGLTPFESSLGVDLARIHRWTLDLSSHVIDANFEADMGRVPDMEAIRHHLLRATRAAEMIIEASRELTSSIEEQKRLGDLGQSYEPKAELAQLVHATVSAFVSDPPTIPEIRSLIEDSAPQHVLESLDVIKSGSADADFDPDTAYENFKWMLSRLRSIEDSGLPRSGVWTADVRRPRSG